MFLKKPIFCVGGGEGEEVNSIVHGHGSFINVLDLYVLRIVCALL